MSRPVLKLGSNEPKVANPEMLSIEKQRKVNESPDLIVIDTPASTIEPTPSPNNTATVIRDHASTGQNVPIGEVAPIITSSGISAASSLDKVESRYSKHEKDRNEFEERQRQKDLERLKKAKQEKKEAEERLRLQLEAEKLERVQKLSQSAKASVPVVEPIVKPDAIQIKVDQQNREADKLAAQQRERLRLKKEEAERVKMLVEEDRRRRFGTPMPTVSSSTNPTVSSQPNSDSASVKASGGCLLQIRLPKGKVLKHKFEASDKLQSVFDLVASELPPGENFALLSAFPKKEFGQAELEMTLASCGLVPSASVNVIPAASRGVVVQGASTPAASADADTTSALPSVDEMISSLPLRSFEGMSLNGESNDCTSHFVPGRHLAIGVCGLSYLCKKGYDIGEELKTLPCNHAFHSGCIIEWLQDNQRCPVCNEKPF